MKKTLEYGMDRSVKVHQEAMGMVVWYGVRLRLR